MIVLRRALALPIILIGVLLLLLTLVLLRVNGTVLEPTFYTSTLYRVDAYNFLYDEVVPLAVRESGLDLEEQTALGLDLGPEAIAARVKNVLPPDWLERNVTAVVNAAGPYITGQADAFELTIRIDDRAEALAAEVRGMVEDMALHRFLLEEIVRGELERSGDLLDDLPFGLRLTPDEVVDAAAEIVPEPWLKEQAIAVIDAVVPYLTGDADSFEVVIPLEDRAAAAVQVIQRWLLEDLGEGAYDYLLQDLLAPVVRDALADVPAFPFGVTLTEADVLSALSEAVPEDWVADRMSEIVNAVGAYLTGASATVNVTVPIGERTEAAALALVRLLDAKLEAAYNAAPVCTPSQMAAFAGGEFPECRVPGYTYEQAKAQTGFDVEDEWLGGIVSAMPASIQLDETVLGTESIEDVRAILVEGIRFTHQTLRDLLMEQGGPELVGLLDDMRGYMANGVRVTHEDVEQFVPPELETARGWVGMAKSWAWLLLLPPLVAVAIVGFLGGRSWGGRLAWAGVPLLLGGALVAGIFSAVPPYLRRLSQPYLEDLTTNPAIVAKLVEVRDDLLSSFTSPLVTQGVVVGVMGLAAMAVGALLARRRQGAVAPQPVVVEDRERELAAR